MPDVTPPSQVHDGPISTTTPTSFFKRLLGPTQTIEPTGPALTLRYALPSDTDTSTASPSSTRTARHMAWSWSPRSAACGRARGYDRPAIG